MLPSFFSVGNGCVDRAKLYTVWLVSFYSAEHWPDQNAKHKATHSKKMLSFSKWTKRLITVDQYASIHLTTNRPSLRNLSSFCYVQLFSSPHPKNRFCPSFGSKSEASSLTVGSYSRQMYCQITYCWGRIFHLDDSPESLVNSSPCWILMSHHLVCSTFTLTCG